MTNQHILIAGFLMLLPCALLFYYYVRAKEFLDEMWAVKTYDAVELRRMCKGGFDVTVEIQGAVTCDKPLISYAAKVPCCWFHIKVRREQERSSLTEFVPDRHKAGPKDDWVTEMDSHYSAIFKIEDKTGYTLVNPDGADLDTIKVFDGIVLSSQPWFERFVSGSSGRFHVTEEVFLPTGYAYVLGQASCVGDDVMIHRPERGYVNPDDPFFVISRKTEKELDGYRGVTVHVCLFFGVASLLTSALFILQGLGVVKAF